MEEIMIKITLKDGSERLVEQGISLYEVAKSISGRLAKEAMVGEVNSEVKDLSFELMEDCEVNLLKYEDLAGRDAYRHTSAHIMAQAVKRLFPDAKLAIGPAIEQGYYYDFDTSHVFIPEDLEKIEAEMKKIIKEDHEIIRFELPRDEALERMQKAGEDYKVELINDLPADEVISFYQQGEFVDLCAGKHVRSTGVIKSFKLLSIAGAYWKGSEKNKMLQRIYGTSFPKASLLEAHLHMLEEAKKRDHRKLGKELNLFALLEEGPGFPFFLPHGMVVINELKKYWREVHTKADYVEIETPIILNRQLWETSGHWFHYRENMYSLKIDEEDYAIKPMNCPGGMLVYKTQLRSYKDMPMRVAEMGRVHRHELSGALHGLMRVRAFTQDDAHIFMLPEQIKEEIMGVCRLVEEIYTRFGFTYEVYLSTKPEKSMGSDELWALAESSLQGALDEMGYDYKINEGDGAFYGPKIDFYLKDSLGRTWQCGTIQLDMQIPERFELKYVGADGEKHTPVVIHRAILGSIERFFANVLEEFAGKFPTWLAPVQVKLLTIADRHIPYAKSLKERLKSEGIRAELDHRAEKIGFKIREAQLQKGPYMLVIGDKECEGNELSVRSRDLGDLGSMDVEKFIDQIKKEIQARQLHSIFEREE